YFWICLDDACFQRETFLGGCLYEEKSFKEAKYNLVNFTMTIVVSEGRFYKIGMKEIE
ncbi:18862_t:CDS:2, partial [Dentiscutata erythropus]